VIVGGSHENERRAGTENLAGIMGLVEAVERFVREPVFSPAQLKPLTEKLLSAIESLEGVQFVGSRSQRLSNTIAFVVSGADSISTLAALDLEGVCASSGSACSAGSLQPSHVVRALGAGDSLAQSLIRFSLGRESTAEEVDYVAGVLPEVIRRVTRRYTSGNL
jgi:cysteine desulfurase